MFVVGDPKPVCPVCYRGIMKNRWERIKELEATSTAVDVVNSGLEKNELVIHIQACEPEEGDVLVNPWPLYRVRVQEATAEEQSSRVKFCLTAVPRGIQAETLLGVPLKLKEGTEE